MMHVAGDVSDQLVKGPRRAANQRVRKRQRPPRALLPGDEWAAVAPHSGITGDLIPQSPNLNTAWQMATILTATLAVARSHFTIRVRVWNIFWSEPNPISRAVKPVCGFFMVRSTCMFGKWWTNTFCILQILKEKNIQTKKPVGNIHSLCYLLLFLLYVGIFKFIIIIEDYRVNLMAQWLQYIDMIAVFFYTVKNPINWKTLSNFIIYYCLYLFIIYTDIQHQ